MKKIVNILFAALVAVMAVSCEKFLDSKSPSAFDAATVYSNYSLTENTIFSIAQSFGETNNYRGRYLSYIGMNSDIEWYNTYKPADEKYQIAGYAQQPNNAQLNLNNGPFAKMYEAIERANLVIEGVREYGSPETNKDMAYLLGEALTLRAMIYYDLVRAWGDVPARFESTTSETIYKAKESRDVIFKQLLADLDEAIPNLPYPGATSATSRTDRVNKLFAEGLYARIALMASGYAQRPDDGMVGTGDLGTNRLSNDPDLQKSVLYPKALAYLEDAITSGTASLEDYETLWKNQSNQDNLVAGPGHETLFVIPFSDGRGRWNYTFAVRSEGSSFAGGANVTRGGDAGPVPTMWFDYDPNDVRRDITCVNWRWNKEDEPELVGIQRWYFGKYRWDWMTRNPYTGGNDDGVKPVVLRYADILLMAAEIANELNKLEDAKGYLLQVRSRAYKGHEAEAEAYVNGLTRETFFDAIVEERALEFCGEFLRKADLIRWNLLKAKPDEARAALIAMRDRTGDYAALPDYVYYSYEADGQTIKMYGLNPGETNYDSLGEGWEPYLNTEGELTKYYSTSETGGLTAKANTLYRETVDPEQHMYWPICQVDLTNSVNTIVNDYGY